MPRIHVTHTLYQDISTAVVPNSALQTEKRDRLGKFGDVYTLFGFGQNNFGLNKHCVSYGGQSTLRALISNAQGNSPSFVVHFA